MMDLALRLRQIELATKAHRSSAGSSSVFLAIVQWKSRSAFARVSAGLWRKSRAEPTESTPTSSTPVWQAMALVFRDRPEVMWLPFFQQMSDECYLCDDALDSGSSSPTSR